MTATSDPYGARATLAGPDGTVVYYRLAALAKERGVDLDALPHTVKILLENVLRNQDKPFANPEDVLALARWTPRPVEAELPFLPSRVVLQDFTGVPAVVDLAAMRSAVARAGGDPERINPLVPADLVIDHSVQVDAFGSSEAFRINVEREYERNRERYALLRWAQKAFRNFRVVPPGTGIVHQVNLEYLASVVALREENGETLAFPDTLVGTDSHTTMINGLGVLGWGVGGIEAEAVLLGQPLYQLAPVVVGCELRGALAPGTTATDLVLTLTQLLRAHGVVGKLVELTGPGVGQLTLADRATISNMAPEYGATAALFPIDDETLRYLRMTGRDPKRVALVERYAKEQGLFRTDGSPAPRFSERLELDLATVEPSLAGPKRPQDRAPLGQVRRSFRDAFPRQFQTPNDAPAQEAKKRFDWEGGTVNEAQAPSEPVVDVNPRATAVEIEVGGERAAIGHGSVVIAAITSCTNTSNPTVMIGAGLLAKKARERGLGAQPWVKTSLAPGSRVVTDYLRRSGLLAPLEALGFHLVGYGCTTCIGNSGPLPEPVAAAVGANDLVVAAVLSGNRNFEGRIHPQVRAAYLASPPLVVAYALAGTVDIDLTTEPLGTDAAGRPVHLRDLWPSAEEVRAAVASAVGPDLFRESYGHVFEGDQVWRTLPVPEGSLYAWDAGSTYIQEPPFFVDLPPAPAPLADIEGARALVVLGDSVTTDHISPAGSIPKDGPAGRYLVERGVEARDFNSFGSRRGNHEVMLRGTFGNVRLRNELAPGREGDWTVHLPSGEEMRIYDASRRYLQAGTPLLVVAGKEYGSGSSRDWAAKGTLLLGVRAVLAESYERIHRSNLVGMGVLPLQFEPGASRASLGFTGRETFSIRGLSDDLAPRAALRVTAEREDGGRVDFAAIARVDSPVDVGYLRHGGILQMVLRSMMGRAGAG
jgi:aconitate hydratase